MNHEQHRYPGAQPFGDDEFSRRIFFGREKASAALTDQILANRLIVVYAKSGSGKTSLLNAGVAPRLRDALHVPLFVRVNDRKRGALGSVFEGIRSECERQKLEFVAGDTSSLWTYFKTVEFWRDDVLLTPVLILDQFEELFTLQSAEEREKFLADLGSLLRGTPPESLDPAASGISGTPPPIHVVLSLREDFLGLLDEGSDRIPEIMNHRFRLGPLSAEMAAEAITKPAALEGESLTTRAFQLQPQCVASVVDYLSRSASSREEASTRQVEPFHLQLICQMIESIAASRQKASASQVVLSFADIGGDAAMAETLETFYADAIHSLPRKKRRPARRVCAHWLISVEGRRLSVDERELCRHSGLTRDDLQQLQNRRLLRTDRRSDRTYYELGHDALVEPVLGSRRTQAAITYTAAIFGGSTLSSFMAGMAIAFAALARDPDSSMVGMLVFSVLCAIVSVVGFIWLRAGVRLRARYSEHDEDTSGKPKFRLRKIAGWILLFLGPSTCLPWLLWGLWVLAAAAAIAIGRGQLPAPLAFLNSAAVDTWPYMQTHPVRELLWILVDFQAVTVLGAWLYRCGGKLLWPSQRAKVKAQQTLKGKFSLALACLRSLAGAVGLILGGLSIYTVCTCSSTWNGVVARWVQWPIMPPDLTETCNTIYTHSAFFSADGVYTISFIVSILILSAAALWIGVAAIFSVIAYRREEKQKPAALEVATIAAAWLVAFAVLAPFARALWGPAAKTPVWIPQDKVDVWVAGTSVIAHSSTGGKTWDSQTVGSSTANLYATSANVVVAAGDDGSIWRTTDAGKHWAPVHWGAGEHKGLTLNAVWFATPQIGWIVGHGALLKTEDGGNSWQERAGPDQKDYQSFLDGADLLDVWFVSPQEGWISATAGTIFHTSDGGATWELQKTPDVMLPSTATPDKKPDKKQVQKPQPVNIYYIAFATPQCGWASGWYGHLFRTVDGGKTWTKTSLDGASATLYGVDPVSCSVAWVVGTSGTILYTQDGGNKWMPRTSGVDATLTQVKFTDARTGWVIGLNGMVLHTDDGGMTWSGQQFETDKNLWTISAIGQAPSASPGSVPH